MRKRFQRALLAMGALAIGLGAVVAFAGATTSLPTTGDGITPTFVVGSGAFADCASAPTGQSHIFGLKVEKGSATAYNGTWDKSNTSHTHGSDNPLRVTISNSKVVNGVSSFDWSANMPVDYVFVKGGSVDGNVGAVKYDYASYGWGGNPATGPWSDTGLVYPKESISHVLFCTVKKLRVEKTAVTGFAREYTWTITKKVKTTGNDYASSASLSLLNGNSGDAHWQIVADQTGMTDNGFNVGGVITVLNSSPFDVAGIVDESLSNVTFGGACTGKNGTNDKANVSVGKGASVACTYSAPLASKTNGTNSVEVDPTTPDWMSTTSASKPYTFGNPTSEKNKTVRWSDSNGQSSTGITGDTTTTYDTSHSCPENRTVTNIATLYGDANANLGSSTATVGITCTPPQKLTISKTANGTFDRSWTWTVDKQVKTDGAFGESASLGLPAGGSGSAHYKVTVGATSADGPFTVSGTITIGNPNATAVSGVSVTDAIAGATIDCLPADGNQSTGLTIAGNGTLSCSYTVTKDVKPTTNTASVTASNSAYNNTSATVAVSYAASPANETGTSVVAKDVFDGAAAETLGTVTTGDLSNGTKQFTYDRTLSCGNTHTYDNTASIYAKAEAQQALASDSARVVVTCASPVALTVTKTVDTTSFDRDWDWTIDKQVKTTGETYGKSASLTLDAGTSGAAHYRVVVNGSSADGNYVVRGTIRVQNTNNVDIAGVTVTDILPGAVVDCDPGTDGAQNSGLMVAKKSTLICTYSATSAGVKPESNTATATVSGNESLGGSSQAVGITFGAPNQIDAVVSALDAFDGAGGATIAGAGTISGAGEHVFTYDRALRCGASHTYDNTASVVPVNGSVEQAYGSSSASVAVTCNPPKALEVTKTATPSFTRTWNWQVEKTADQTSFALKDGGTASTNWNVTLVKGEPVDSDWSLSGTIAVHNPNAFPVSGVSVADGLGGNVTCPSTEIAANGTLPCTYVVSLESGASGENTATASTETQGVPGGSGKAEYAFTEPTSTVNENVDVADTNGMTWSDLDEGFKDSYPSGTLPCRDAKYTNTVFVFGDEGATLDTASADITTTCSNTPPQVTIPETPKIDIGVTKSATGPTLTGGTVTYTVVVSNVAQVTATGVDLSDPAPTGVSFKSASSSDAAVSCTVVASLVTCNRPGAFAVGASFVVTIKATVTGAAGTTITNEVLVNTPGDIDPTNNRANASTLLGASLKPPVKPKPKPPVVCSTLNVTPKTVVAGKKSKIQVVVTAAGKPVKGASVRIVGPGINRVVKTGKNGKAVAVVTSTKSGIVTVSITGKKGCNTARVGVVGAFEPPVTG